jgi:hypothetical protein
VRNAIDNKFDMSLMRMITTSELKFRMECLNKCYKKVKHLKRNYWLVGVEKVNWQVGANGYCIPRDLFGNDNSWAIGSRTANARNGFLFLFAKTEGEPTPVCGSNRMIQNCTQLAIFQVSREGFAHCTLKSSNQWLPEWI